MLPLKDDNEHTNHAYIYIIFLVVLILFVFIGAFMEHKRFKFGHETGVILIIGIIVSVIAYEVDKSHGIVPEFNTVVFFDLALPAILFAAGYNMRRKEFFNNFVNIAKLGIFGSIFTFVMFFLLNLFVFKVIGLKMYDPEQGTVDFDMTPLEIMLVSSIMVSSDIIAAMSILKFEEQPHIFSIILGEGLFNDVVVIVLQQTV